MARSSKVKRAKDEFEAKFGLAHERFTTEVKRRMTRHGASGAELARRMGISRAAVSRILLPGANPTLRTMAALADALDGEIEVVFHRPRPLSTLPPGLKLELNPPKRKP